MIFKSVKIPFKFYIAGIVFLCVFNDHSVYASKEPIIRVLIAKNNNLRIRSDRFIPLIIKGEIFSNKKIRGLTLKNQENRKILFFDENKQKIYYLKNK